MGGGVDDKNKTVICNDNRCTCDWNMTRTHRIRLIFSIKSYALKELWVKDTKFKFKMSR